MIDFRSASKTCRYIIYRLYTVIQNRLHHYFWVSILIICRNILLVSFFVKHFRISDLYPAKYFSFISFLLNFL